MDSTDSNIYVAELLQQLEELKRKKARRLQKLKKLKKPPSHNESVGKDISCCSTENVSLGTDSKRENSLSNCAKCGLSLISKDSACIQCISAEHKENKPKDLDKCGITLDGESVIPKHQTIADPETPKNVKPGLKHKNLKEISNLNSIDEVQHGDSQSVSESLPNKIGADPKERLSFEPLRKQRKRSSAVENDLEEGDHKKPKLSEEALKNDSNGISLMTDDTFNGENVSSFHSDNESKGKPQSKGSDDGIDESIFKDMSCFLSSSPLVENEDKIEAGVDGPKQLIKESCLKSSICSEIFLKDIHNSFVFNNAAEATDSNCLSESECIDNCKPERKVEAVSNDSFLNGKSALLKTDLAKQPEMVPDTMVEDTLADIPAESLGNNDLIEDSVQDHVLEKKLLPEPNIGCDFSTKNSLSLSKEVNDVTKDLKHTFSSFSVMDEPIIKCQEDTCEDILTDSQLVKDLKTEDFSSFENSDSPEKVQPVTETLETPNLFIPNMYSKEPIPEIVQLNGSHNTKQLIPLDGSKVLEDNETPNLLEHCKKEIHKLCKDHPPDEEYLNCIPETSALKCDKVQLNIDEREALFDDVMTADIDFESTSLEVADTLEDLLTKSNDGSVSNHGTPSIVSNEHTSIDVLELNHPETEIFTIPETVLLETKPNNKCNSDVTKDKRPNIQSPILDKDRRPNTSSWLAGNRKELQSTNAEVACDYFEETQCDSLDQLQTIQDTVFLNAEDSLALGNCRDFPFMDKKAKKKSSFGVEEISAEDQETTIMFSCSLQGDIEEPVNDIKLVTFNKSSYVFIQHLTWIQVWRQEESHDWSKIFSHQVDDELRLKEICFTKDCKHLILIMLLHGDQVHCLQFLLFESEVRVIKLMEHTHWMNNKCPEETVLLCGLEDLKFATAQGKDRFEVFVHIFSSLDDLPKLAMVTLGSTPGLLHSLCRIEKLPNALMGSSHSTLYVWHLLEARLVTSVLLQLPDQLTIEKCIWATIESGLVFLMTVCKGRDDFQSCQLLAANLATGFCQTAMSYSFMPSKELQYVKNKNLKAIYYEPFLAVSSDDGCFLWSVSEEYCCAALGSKTRVTAVNIGNDREDQLIVVVGNVSGCVHCYSLKCP